MFPNSIFDKLKYVFKNKRLKMAKVKITKVYDKDKPHVICDTNVWYSLASATFNKPKDVLLIPTAFSLEELATSTMMAKHPKYYQEVVSSIYNNCGPIIPENPFDFVLSNNYQNYIADEEPTKKLLKGFSSLMERKIDENNIDETLKNKIIKDCEDSRKPSSDFATLGNDELLAIRKSINVGVGQKEHLKQDTAIVNREFVKYMFNVYAKNKNYSINWDRFDWSKIDLFMSITEIFFKKLETTKDMKIDQNDIVDWFNLLYVSPEDKYLTFEIKWRKYILNEESINGYLYC
jgi:hypothetical protein